MNRDAMRKPERVFVCYARQDRAVVDGVVRELERLGHAMWIDRAGIGGADSWRGKIVSALADCYCILFFGSEASYASGHVATELTLAEESGLPILPVHLEEIRPYGEIAYLVIRLQRIAVRSAKDRNGLAAIDDALQQLWDGKHGNPSGRPPTPFSPPSGPAPRLPQGPPSKSKFLAAP